MVTHVVEVCIVLGFLLTHYNNQSLIISCFRGFLLTVFTVSFNLNKNTPWPRCGRECVKVLARLLRPHDDSAWKFTVEKQEVVINANRREEYAKQSFIFEVCEMLKL